MANNFSAAVQAAQQAAENAADGARQAAKIAGQAAADAAKSAAQAAEAAKNAVHATPDPNALPADPSHIAQKAASASEACFASFGGLCLSNKIDVALIVTVLIFFGGLWYNARLDYKRKQEEKAKAERAEEKVRRQYLLALREEIGLNIDGLAKSLSRFPGRTTFEEFFAKSRFARPLITYSYYSVIFRNRTEVLQDLPDTIIKNIVDFYGKMEEIAIDCASVNGPSFVSISAGGRLDTMLDIRNQIQVAKQQGETMRDAITQHLTDRFGAPSV